MKEISKHIISLIIFIMLGICLFSGISEILRKKTGGRSDMIHSFYGIEKNTLDVLCMGSSHGYSSFQPNTLWREYGLTSYVMCSPRQTAASTYYLLQEALKYQKPKVLFLETYYFFCGKKYTNEAALRLGFDGTRLSRTKYDMVEDLLAGKGLKEKLSYYIPFLKYHSRWGDLNANDFSSTSYLKGSIFNFKVYPMEEPELPQDAEDRKLPGNVETYLKKIIKLCEENKIQLILYAAPYSWKSKQENFFIKQRINILLKPYLDELEIPYLDIQRADDAGIDYASDFRDYSHLNTNGAIKVTRYLGKYLAENYELPDHRSDAAYASWDDDCEKFEEAMEKAAG